MRHFNFTKLLLFIFSIFLIVSGCSEYRVLDEFIIGNWEETGDPNYMPILGGDLYFGNDSYGHINYTDSIIEFKFALIRDRVKAERNNIEYNKDIIILETVDETLEFEIWWRIEEEDIILEYTFPNGQILMGLSSTNYFFSRK